MNRTPSNRHVASPLSGAYLLCSIIATLAIFPDVSVIAQVPVPAPSFSPYPTSCPAASYNLNASPFTLSSDMANITSLIFAAAKSSGSANLISDQAPPVNFSSAFSMSLALKVTFSLGSAASPPVVTVYLLSNSLVVAGVMFSVRSMGSSIGSSPYTLSCWSAVFFMVNTILSSRI